MNHVTDGLLWQTQPDCHKLLPKNSAREVKVSRYSGLARPPDTMGLERVRQASGYRSPLCAGTFSEKLIRKQMGERGAVLGISQTRL